MLRTVCRTPFHDHEDSRPLLRFENLPETESQCRWPMYCHVPFGNTLMHAPSTLRVFCESQRSSRTNYSRADRSSGHHFVLRMETRCTHQASRVHSTYSNQRKLSTKMRQSAPMWQRAMQVFAFLPTKFIRAGASSPMLSFVCSLFRGHFSPRCSLATWRAKVCTIPRTTLAA
jgi:hypothetical protein